MQSLVAVQLRMAAAGEIIGLYLAYKNVAILHTPATQSSGTVAIRERSENFAIESDNFSVNL